MYLKEEECLDPASASTATRMEWTEVEKSMPTDSRLIEQYKARPDSDNMLNSGYVLKCIMWTCLPDFADLL